VAVVAGARGFFPKQWSSDAIVAAVRRVFMGKTLFLRSSDAEPSQPAKAASRARLLGLVS
jgi:DNA-binding NarL/FixJ family response regulator